MIQRLSRVRHIGGDIVALRLYLQGALLLLLSITAAGQTVMGDTRLPDIGTGQLVTIPVKDLPSDAKDVRVQFVNPAGTQSDTPATRIDVKSGVVESKVPDVASRYEVRVVIGGKPIPVPGELRVRNDAVVAPKITSITPTTVYRNALKSGFDFDVVGENFSPVVGGTELVSPNGGLIAKSQTAACESKVPCVQIDQNDPTHKLHVFNYAGLPFEGPSQLRVRVGALQSDGVQSFTLSRATISEVEWWSFVVWGILFLLIYLIMLRGVGGHRVGGRKYSALAAFFLDPATNTYSLSKFQLLAWSAVAVYGYIYFFLCHSLVQWHLDFPDVPEGLPSLLGISAGTTVAAVGLQTYRGSKGSGQFYPSWADFISSGGSVVAERFQFFVWTLVGCGGFLALIWMSNPASLTDLPKIPTNFFNLMGISSVGYLAGKALRKPGPVIQKITPTIDPAANSLKLQIDGENMQADAGIKIDGEDKTPISVARTDQQSAADPTFSSSLTYVLNGNGGLLKGTHKLELTNKDGQVVGFEFTSNPPGIDANQSIPANKQEVPLDIKGHDLVNGSVVEWTPPNAKDSVKVNDVTYVDDTKLTAKLTPGETKGLGTIAVISPAGVRAIGSLEVK